MPVCASWFGEINKDYGTLLTKLAREAATGDEGMQISTLVNTDWKGGAFSDYAPAM